MSTARGYEQCFLGLASVSALLTLGGCAEDLPPPAAAEGNAYYVYNDQRIALVEAGDYIGLDCGDDPCPELPLIENEDRGINLSRSPPLDAHGIVIMNLQDGAGSVAFDDVFRDVNVPGGTRRTAVPVFETDGVLLVLTGDFEVQFRPNAVQNAAQEIEDLLTRTGAVRHRSSEYFDGRYTLRFPDKTPREALDAINNEFNAAAVDHLVDWAEPNFVRIARPQAGRRSSDTLESELLSTNTLVTIGGPAPPCPPGAQPNDEYFCYQWALPKIHAPGVWPETQGQGTTIAIVDDGLDDSHTDLMGKTAPKIDTTNALTLGPNYTDGHGTAVAGIAAANTDNHSGIAGVAPMAQILPIRITYTTWNGCNPNVFLCRMWDDNWAADGIAAAANAPADVVNNSWVAGGYAGSPVQKIDSSIDFAIANNAVLVFGAGNDGLIGGSVRYPANLANQKTIITVSATNSDDTLAITSSHGPEVCLSAPGPILDPDREIVTTDVMGAAGAYPTNYHWFFGETSAAAAFVSGAAALLRSKYPDAHPIDVRKWLLIGADDLGPPKYDEQFGHGRLNIQNALQAATLPLVDVTIDVPVTGGHIFAIARASQAGQPIVGTVVTFTSSKAYRVSVRPPVSVTTNSEGIAIGRLWVRPGGDLRPVAIEADTGASLDSVVVRVGGGLFVSPLPPDVFSGCETLE